MNTCVVSVTGNVYNILDDVIPVSIEDVAHSLAGKLRFGGHLDWLANGGHNLRMYSVAHHSLRVAELCGDYALDGLLHDMQEALLADVPSPVKATLRLQSTVWDDLEERVHKAMRRGLGLPERLSGAAEDAVAAADKQALLEEVSTCFSLQAQEAWIKLGYEIDSTFKYKHICPLSRAKERFVEEFHRFAETATGRPQSLRERHGWGVVCR